MQIVTDPKTGIGKNYHNRMALVTACYKSGYDDPCSPLTPCVGQLTTRLPWLTASELAAQSHIVR